MGSARDARVKGSITTGSDFLQLNIADAPPGRRAAWLADQLRDAIASGQLPVGSTLPATRVLAEELAVSRGLVTEAYRRLTEDGHVVGRGRAGTEVVAAPILAPPVGPALPALPVASSATASGARSASGGPLFHPPPGPDVFDALRAASARVDLSPGVPDLTAFPRAAWLRAERTVLTHLVASDFGYGDPRGAPAMRSAVTHWLARYRGMRVDPAGVVIVAGVAQAIMLCGSVLRAAGIGAIAVEEPGSLGARQHLRSLGLDTPPVAVDSSGARVDELRASGAAAALLTPAHQFPTGVVLDGPRRRELLDWAGEGGLVLEDDYDAEHRYDRAPVSALHAMRPDRVCYLGSVSKLLAPALRTGWMVPTPQLADAVIEAKRYADLGNPVLAQLVLAELMESGELERQLRYLRRRHRRRRDQLIAAVRRHLPEARVHGAAAGLHLLVSYPGDRPDTEVAALALERGVKVQPLSWHAQRDGARGLVLGYAARTGTELDEGIAVLAQVLRS